MFTRHQSLARRRAARLARRAAFVATWWSGYRAARGFSPPYFVSESLQVLTGETIRRLAAALRLLGWQECALRLPGGRRRSVWVPPDSPLQRHNQGPAARHSPTTHA